MSKWDSFIQVKFLRPIRMNAIIKILSKLPAGSILDIGCMDDYLLKELNNQFGDKFEYSGIDDNPKLENNNIVKQNVEQISKNKKYDIIICTEVLEHLDNPVDAIKKLKRLSKRFILISVPNEPFFSFFRLFLPAKEHLWTIFPWALDKHLGEPILHQKACFNRTYIALWDLKNKGKKDKI
ncbi:MAG TPA: class I SAM-dependent methyltransferase [Candidatus Paceibacterota bacterium]|nr:class I SAM-dependent methyltransferase [Candidatus Paceibacterota bacterium]